MLLSIDFPLPGINLVTVPEDDENERDQTDHFRQIRTDRIMNVMQPQPTGPGQPDEGAGGPSLGLRASISTLFFMTGAAGLAYELVWTRWLELLLGSTTYAATAVLAAFMGGLALGGAMFGRIADRTGRRLTLYGWLEIAVGLYGIAFPALLAACTGLYVT